jgi:hypothetical protein
MWHASRERCSGSRWRVRMLFSPVARRWKAGLPIAPRVVAARPSKGRGVRQDDRRDSRPRRRRGFLPRFDRRRLRRGARRQQTRPSGNGSTDIGVVELRRVGPCWFVSPRRRSTCSRSMYRHTPWRDGTLRTRVFEERGDLGGTETLIETTGVPVRRGSRSWRGPTTGVPPSLTAATCRRR